MSREMKDSGIPWIGEIPQSWGIEKIKRLLKYKSVKNKANEQVLSLYRDYGVVPKNSRDDNHNVTSEDTSTYKFVECGDFVVNKMKAWQGSMAVSSFQGIISPAYHTFKFMNDDIDKKYIHYLLRNESYKPEYMRLSTGLRVGQWDLSVDDFLNISFVLPTKSEQTLIADYLDKKCAEIDCLIALQEKMIEKLTTYKQSVITEAVTKGLDPNVKMKDSGVEWIAKIPEHWNMKKGKYLFRQRNERGNTIELQLLSPTQKFGCIPQSLYEELTGATAVKLNEKTELNLLKTIHKGDFCISLRSFQGGFEYSNYEGVVSPAYQVFYPTGNEVFRGYYKYMFKDGTFIEKMNSFTLSLRDGKNIAFADFGNTLLPLPPVKEQTLIADYLDQKCAEIERMIEIKKEKIEKLKTYKKSIIFEYVTGKKEVPHA